MKLTLVFLFTVLTISSTFAQSAPGKKLVQITESSPVSVYYHTLTDTTNRPNKGNYFINGINYGHPGPVFNTENIQAINIEKEGSKILITLKSGYQPNFMSLSQLREKYIKSKNQTALYILDGNLIADNRQMIDENYVLNINVRSTADMPYLNDQLTNVDVISITLKSKANLEKANTVYIKGNTDVGK